MKKKILTFKLRFFVYSFVFFFISCSFAQDNINTISWATNLKHNLPTVSRLSDEFAQELINYINKDKKNDFLIKPLTRENMLTGMANGSLDIVIPETILRGIKYSVKYDYVPWGMAVPSLEFTNKFCRYIAISRRNELNNINDISNTTWCVAGRFAELNFFATCHKLKELLKATNLCHYIKLHHIFDDDVSLAIKGKRHTIIQNVLVYDSDWAVVPEYDFKSYIKLFPAISNKLKEVKWLKLDVRMPGYFILCKKTSLEKLEEYRKIALKIHTTPSGNQFMISSGFERICKVPDFEFKQLTNWYKYLPEKDDFNLSK